MRSNNAFGMKFECVPTNFFQNAVNEKIPIELFLQDEDLMFDKNTIVIIEAEYLIVLSENNCVVSVEDAIIIFGGNFSLKISDVLFYF